MHVLAGGARALVVTYFGFYDWTSRGQLHLMVVRAAVQWLAARCRVCRSRAIDRSTSRSACSKLTCCEWLCLHLSGASGAQSGWSPASQTDMARTVVSAVAPGCSAARLIRILRSRKKVSLFGPSGAATRLAHCVTVCTEGVLQQYFHF